MPNTISNAEYLRRLRMRQLGGDTSSASLSDEAFFDTFMNDQMLEKESESDTKYLLQRLRAQQTQDKPQSFEEVVSASQKEINAWDAVRYNVIDTGYQLAKGFFGFFEGLGDLIIGGLGAIGTWFGADDQWAKDAINYEWAGKAAQVATNASGFWGWGLDGARDFSEGENGKTAFENTIQDYNWKQNLLGESAYNFTTGVEYSIGNMMPSIALGDVIGAGGGIASGSKEIANVAAKVAKGASVGMMATSAAGRGVEEAIKEGASIHQALAYGALSGGVEALSEYALEAPLNKLGKFIGKSTDTIVKLMPDTVGGALGQVAIGGVGKRLTAEFVEEGLEEVFSDLLNPLIKSVYKGDIVSNYKELATPEGALSLVESFLAGGISSGVMGGADIVSKYGFNYNAMQAGTYAEAIQQDYQDLVESKKGEVLTPEEAQAFLKNQAKNLEKYNKYINKLNDKQKANLLKNLTGFTGKGGMKDYFDSRAKAINDSKQEVVKMMNSSSSPEEVIVYDNALKLYDEQLKYLADSQQKFEKDYAKAMLDEFYGGVLETSTGVQSLTNVRSLKDKLEQYVNTTRSNAERNEKSIKALQNTITKNLEELANVESVGDKAKVAVSLQELVDDLGEIRIDDNNALNDVINKTIEVLKQDETVNEVVIRHVASKVFQQANSKTKIKFLSAEEMKRFSENNDTVVDGHYDGKENVIYLNKDNEEGAAIFAHEYISHVILDELDKENVKKWAEQIRKEKRFESVKDTLVEKDIQDDSEIVAHYLEHFFYGNNRYNSSQLFNRFISNDQLSSLFRAMFLRVGKTNFESKFLNEVKNSLKEARIRFEVNAASDFESSQMVAKNSEKIKNEREDTTNDDFRRVQEEGRRNFDKPIGERVYCESDEGLRQRLSTIFRRRLGARGFSARNSHVLHLRNVAGQPLFDVYDTIDVDTYKEIFNTARLFTHYGELVDAIDSTESFEGAKCYLSVDGLSGFVIKANGDLTSVFNSSDKRGWLKAVAPIIKEKALTLDCYASYSLNLPRVYRNVLGFKTASIMDWNPEYDRDHVGEIHNEPKVVFMVNSDEDIKSKNFGMDDYDAAVAYRDSFKKSPFTIEFEEEHSEMLKAVDSIVELVSEVEYSEKNDTEYPNKTQIRKVERRADIILSELQDIFDIESKSLSESLNDVKTVSDFEEMRNNYLEVKKIVDKLKEEDIFYSYYDEIQNGDYDSANVDEPDYTYIEELNDYIDMFTEQSEEADEISDMYYYTRAQLEEEPAFNGVITPRFGDVTIEDFRLYESNVQEFNKKSEEIKNVIREVARNEYLLPARWVHFKDLSDEDWILIRKRAGGAQLTLPEFQTVKTIQEAHDYVVSDESAAERKRLGEDTELHKKIAEEFIQTEIVDKGVKSERKAVVVYGLPGAGKSTGLDRGFLSTAVENDNDIMKGYAVLSTPYAGGKGAGVVQEAVSEAQAIVWDEIFKNGYNVVYPAIGKKLSKVKGELARLIDNGYDVQINFVDIEPIESLNRAMFRYLLNGRYVDYEYIVSIGEGCRDTFEALTQEVKENGGFIWEGKSYTINESAIKRINRRRENSESNRVAQTSQEGITDLSGRERQETGDNRGRGGLLDESRNERLFINDESYNVSATQNLRALDIYREQRRVLKKATKALSQVERQRHYSKLIKSVLRTEQGTKTSVSQYGFSFKYRGRSFVYLTENNSIWFKTDNDRWHRAIKEEDKILNHQEIIKRAKRAYEARLRATNTKDLSYLFDASTITSLPTNEMINTSLYLNTKSVNEEEAPVLQAEARAEEPVVYMLTADDAISGEEVLDTQNVVPSPSDMLSKVAQTNIIKEKTLKHAKVDTQILLTDSQAALSEGAVDYGFTWEQAQMLTSSLRRAGKLATIYWKNGVPLFNRNGTPIMDERGIQKRSEPLSKTYEKINAVVSDILKNGEGSAFYSKEIQQLISDTKKRKRPDALRNYVTRVFSLYLYNQHQIDSVEAAKTILLNSIDSINIGSKGTIISNHLPILKALLNRSTEAIPTEDIITAVKRDVFSDEFRTALFFLNNDELAKLQNDILERASKYKVKSVFGKTVEKQSFLNSDAFRKFESFFYSLELDGSKDTSYFDNSLQELTLASPTDIGEQEFENFVNDMLDYYSTKEGAFIHSLNLSKDKNAKKLLKELKTASDALMAQFKDPLNTRLKAMNNEIEKKFGSALTEFRDGIADYIKSVQEYAVAKNIVSAADMNFYQKLYPHYIPIPREKIYASNLSLGDVAKYDFIKTRKGSGEVIQPLITSLYNQLNNTIRKASHNDFFTALYESGADHNVRSDYIQLNKEWVDESVLDASDLTFLDALTEAEKEGNVVTYSTRNADGSLTRRRALLSDQAMRGISSPLGSEVTNLEEILNKVKINKLNQVFKNLVTSWNPFFMFTNATRDFSDALFTTKNGVLKYIKEYVKSWAEALSGRSALWDMFIMNGGETSSLLEFRNADELQKAILEYNKSNKTLTKIKDFVPRLNELIELMPRFTEFKLTYSNMLKKGYAREQALTAALADSATITTDFSRGGTITKVLNRTIIPFLNAQVQGACKAANLVMHPRDISAVIMLIIKMLMLGMLPDFLEEILYMNNEDYQAIPEYTKENYYLIPASNGNFIKIPKGHILGVVASLGRQVINISAGKTDLKEGAENVINAFQSNLSPVDLSNGLRTIFTPISDVRRNMTWYGGTIDKQSDLNKRPNERYDTSTSRIAIAIAKINPNWSPKRVEYLLAQYTGVLGDFLLPLTAQEGGDVAKNIESFISQNTTISAIKNNKYRGDYASLRQEMLFAKNDGDDKAAVVYSYLLRADKKLNELEDLIDTLESGEERYTAYVTLREAYREIISNAKAFYEKLQNIEVSLDDKFSLTEAYRQVFGAETALEYYNKEVHARALKANSFGVSFDDFYQLYFSVREAGSKDVAIKMATRVVGNRGKAYALLKLLGMTLKESELKLATRYLK